MNKEDLKTEGKVAVATLICRLISKIPFMFSNGIKNEIGYDVVYRLPKYVIDRIVYNLKGRDKNDK